MKIEFFFLVVAVSAGVSFFLLIVYCLKETGSDFSHTGIANFLAVAVVAVSYKWKHNTFLSILLGTAVNMILIQVI